MWDNRNRVLHDTEHSVARELQIQQITTEFLMGPAGLPDLVKEHFRRSLQELIKRPPAYQTAWLIRIQAARARAERRNERGCHNYSAERAGIQRWPGNTNS
jgi:hypothetical protein